MLTFVMRANQSTLRRALARLPWAQAPGRWNATSATAGPSLARSRSSASTTPPEAWLFPHGTRAIKVVRRRRRAGQAKPSVETVYAITSLRHRDADARLPAAWIRSHWTIENCLHWVATSPRVRTTPACAPATDLR